MKNSYWNTTGISSRFIRELQRYCLMSDQNYLVQEQEGITTELPILI
ncbi:hypothetical protein [Mesobacillus maritimus]|nr:hypothetical protein [Mesobacillus maritimus]